MGGDGTVLVATLDYPDDVIRWNYTSQSPVLVMRASGRHSNQCGRGLTADIQYTAVGKSSSLNSYNYLTSQTFSKNTLETFFFVSLLFPGVMLLLRSTSPPKVTVEQ